MNHSGFKETIAALRKTYNRIQRLLIYTLLDAQESQQNNSG